MSKLKMVAGIGAGITKPTLRAGGGTEPSDNMKPGEHVGICESATTQTKGKSLHAFLKIRFDNGVSLPGWIKITVEGNGVVPMRSRYAQQCAIALGREVEPGDDLDPISVFQGKILRVFCGYRMTERPGGPRR